VSVERNWAREIALATANDSVHIIEGTRAQQVPPDALGHRQLRRAPASYGYARRRAVGSAPKERVLAGPTATTVSDRELVESGESLQH
jgi:hypothetical protein